MKNEILLLGSIILIYGSVLLSYKLFNKTGLYIMTAIATVFANIEVLILIDGFGMEQTLGNVMFAVTYLITDILSENEGKKSASKAVWIGTFASAIMILFTQYWMLYTPSVNDRASEHIKAIFSTTPRLMLASFIAYFISQRFDVFLYHRIWNFTEQKTGNKKKFLWLRNNIATLTAQIANTVLFNLIAFYGRYNINTITSIIISSYVIFIFTSLLDTPVLYVARKMKKEQYCFNR